MAPKFFLSLAALSLSFSTLLFAEEGQSEIQDQKTLALESSPSKEPVQKKRKPHFAGVKRQTPSNKDLKKKSSKVKNEWVSSKTHPKKAKKQVADKEQQLSELPEDRPYFRRTDNALLASAVPLSNASSPLPPPQPPQSEGGKYPRTGFQAPRGHVYLTGDWLYWRVRQEGMEFATSEQIHFDFQSGFRLGIGAHLSSFDGWCIFAEYTRLSPEGSRSVQDVLYPLFLFQGAGSSGNAVTQAAGHWKVGFQSVDIQFGKAYYLTKTLVFSPFFGLKGAWIDQHAHFDYQGGYVLAGQTYRTHFTNDFKGAGPLMGTEMNWQLGAGFSFFGDLAAALLFGQFNNSQRQYQQGGVEVVYLDDNFNLASPFLSMLAGLAWDRNFHRDECHLGLSAGFEAQYFWGQNQTEQFTADTRPTYVRQKGDLAFYGLTLKARLDF